MALTFGAPQYLPLLFAALLLGVLAWWAKRRRRISVGSLVLWELTLKNYSPPRVWRLLPAEVIYALLFGISVPLMLAKPEIKFAAVSLAPPLTAANLPEHLAPTAPRENSAPLKNIALDATQYPQIALAARIVNLEILAPAQIADILVTDKFPERDKFPRRALFLIAPKTGGENFAIINTGEFFTADEIIATPENPTPLFSLKLPTALTLPRQWLPAAEKIWLTMPNDQNGGEKNPFLAQAKIALADREIAIVYFAALPEAWTHTANFPLTLYYLFATLTQPAPLPPTIYPPSFTNTAKTYNLSSLMLIMALGSISGMLIRIRQRRVDV